MIVKFASNVQLAYKAAMRKRKMRAVAKIRQVYCRAHHIHWVRGLLITKERRDIGWKEFRAITGIGERYLKYIKAGHRVGSRETVRKLIEATRRFGIIIHLSDFYDDDANPGDQQIWRPWKDYTH